MTDADMHAHNRRVQREREAVLDELCGREAPHWWCPKCDWSNVGWRRCERCSWHPAQMLTGGRR